MNKRQAPPVKQAQPGLSIIYGNMPKRFRPLDRDLMLIGSAPGCEIGIEAVGVFPVHCVLIRGDDAFYVRNCAGKGGTRLNGAHIQEAKLFDSDVLQIGPFVLEVHVPPGTFPDPAEEGNTAVRERQLMRWLASRRRLAKLALSLRRQLLALRASRGPTQAEAEFARRQADLLRQAEGLRSQIREWEECVRRLDQAEQQLEMDREALARDRKAFQARVLQLEQELEQRRAEVEHAAWEQIDRQRQQEDDRLAQERKALEQERQALHADALELEQAERQIAQERDVLQQQQQALAQQQEKLAQQQEKLRNQQELLDASSAQIAHNRELLAQECLQLEQQRQEVQRRVQQVELAEKQLTAVTQALEQESAALQARREQMERELEQHRASTEAALKQRWEEFQRRCNEAERQHAERLAAAPALPLDEEARRLDIRRREQAHYARHLKNTYKALRKQADRLNQIQQQIQQQWQRLQQQEAAAAPAEETRALEVRRQELDELARHLRGLQKQLREQEEQLTAERRQFEQQREEWARTHADRDGVSASAGADSCVEDGVTLTQRHWELLQTIAELKESHQSFIAEYEAERTVLLKQNEELRQQLASRPEPLVADSEERVRANEQLDELRREIVALRQQLREKDALIGALRGEHSLPASEFSSAVDLTKYEVELNLFRRQLEADRRALNAELRQAKARKEEIEEAARQAELELSRERANLARERAWLERLRDETRLELERLQREAAVRERLVPFQRLAERERVRAQAEAAAQASSSTGRLASLISRLSGQRE